MKRLVTLVLALCLLGAVGCATSEVVVDRTPPPPQEETLGKKPNGDVFWMDGHWAWDSGSKHFYWVSGQWASPRSGRIWQNAYWEPVEGGKYRFVPARWDRLDEQ